MWVFDALQSFIHGLTVDVDPAGRSGSQEVSESHTTARPSAGSERESVFLHGGLLALLLVHLLHFLYDPGALPVSDVLAGLPETQVLRWEQRHRQWAAEDKTTVMQGEVKHNKRVSIAWVASVENLGPWQYII